MDKDFIGWAEFNLSDLSVDIDSRLKQVNLERNARRDEMVNLMIGKKKRNFFIWILLNWEIYEHNIKTKEDSIKFLKTHGVWDSPWNFADEGLYISELKNLRDIVDLAMNNTNTKTINLKCDVLKWLYGPICTLDDFMEFNKYVIIRKYWSERVQKMG